MTAVNSTSDDDLLLAVRYVLEECSAGELAAFEARLGDDPAAQGALVEAVQIIALLQSTPTCEESESSPWESSLQAASAPASRKPLSPARRSWQVASLVAASLLACMAIFWSVTPAPFGNQTVEAPIATSANDPPALAQAWTALDSHQFTPDEAGETDDAHSADDDSAELASDVPDWLLTAVLVEEQQGHMDENDMDFEEETQL